MLRVLQNITPMQAGAPRQSLAREKHGQQSGRLVDKIPHMEVEGLFLPWRASTALVEDGLIFVDKQDEAFRIVCSQMSIQILSKHPRKKTREFITFLDLPFTI